MSCPLVVHVDGAGPRCGAGARGAVRTLLPQRGGPVRAGGAGLVLPLVLPLRALPDLPAALDVLLLLLRLLLDVAGVAGRELQLLLGRQPCLQLAGALQLGVDLRTEEQR